MNSFNAVFMAIKNHCAGQKHIAEIDCFEQIAKEADIPLTRLPLYLDHLQNIGVIKYSLKEKYIYLTTFGMKQKTLVKE